MYGWAMDDFPIGVDASISILLASYWHPSRSGLTRFLSVPGDQSVHLHGCLELLGSAGAYEELVGGLEHGLYFPIYHLVMTNIAMV